MTTTTSPRPPARLPAVRWTTLADLQATLGDVPVERIHLNPVPGTATVHDALELTENGRLTELVDSTLVEKGMGLWESNIGLRLGRLIGNFVEEHDLGAVFGPDATMRMPGGNMRMPDVSFVQKRKVPTTGEKVPFLVPDLAVEVLSESNRPNEIARKLGEFFHGGCKLAWVIDPRKRTADVYTYDFGPDRTVDADGVLDGEDVLPGFSLPMAEVFRGVPEL
jgi:Uma2 family endonuclease